MDDVLLVFSLVLAVLAVLVPGPPSFIGTEVKWWPSLLAASFACFVATCVF